MSAWFEFAILLYLFTFLALWVFKTVNSANYRYRPMRKRIYGK
jgi:hypothetical protein